MNNQNNNATCWSQESDGHRRRQNCGRYAGGGRASRRSSKATTLGWIATAALSCAGFNAAAQGAIDSTGGSMTAIPAPPDATPHQLESNATIHVWEERQDHILSGTYLVDIDGTPGFYDAPTFPPLTGGFIPGGTLVDSHLIHIDAVGGLASLTGTVTFKNEIIGVMVLCDTLDPSDPELGAPGTLLTNCPATADRRRCDWDPGLTETMFITGDRKTLRVTLHSSNLIDQIRVVTRGGNGDPGLGECIDFDTFSPGFPWPCCGVELLGDGYPFVTRPFRWFDGTMFTGGEAYPVQECCDPEHPQALGTNNVMVAPNIPAIVGADGVRKITFCYENCGGNVNLRINGQWEYAWNDFHTMPGNLFAAVGVHINAPPPVMIDGCEHGTVELTVIDDGSCITEFALGGQEFCFDDLCLIEPCDSDPGPSDCVEFNNFSGGAPWFCCDVPFTADGITFVTKRFRWFDGTPTTGGQAQPVSQCCDDDNPAALGLNNIQVEVQLQDFYGTDGVKQITFCYENCGGNLNLTVNGQWEFAWNDFHTMPAGLFAGVGVSINAPPPVIINGCERGSVTLTVIDDEDCITQFRVGGQEFCIDNLCVEGPCDEVVTCPEDINGDNVVDTNDLLILLARWGACPQPCPPTCLGDINGDCVVDTNDLLQLLAAWGDC